MTWMDYLKVQGEFWIVSWKVLGG